MGFVDAGAYAVLCRPAGARCLSPPLLSTASAVGYALAPLRGSMHYMCTLVGGGLSSDHPTNANRGVTEGTRPFISRLPSTSEIMGAPEARDQSSLRDWRRFLQFLPATRRSRALASAWRATFGASYGRRCRKRREGVHRRIVRKRAVPCGTGLFTSFLPSTAVLR
jgi:hypothetical protein